jgi:hypothetical protein
VSLEPRLQPRCRIDEKERVVDPFLAEFDEGQ